MRTLLSYLIFARMDVSIGMACIGARLRLRIDRSGFGVGGGVAAMTMKRGTNADV